MLHLISWNLLIQVYIICEYNKHKLYILSYSVILNKKGSFVQIQRQPDPHIALFIFNQEQTYMGLELTAVFLYMYDSASFSWTCGRDWKILSTKPQVFNQYFLYPLPILRLSTDLSFREGESCAIIITKNSWWYFRAIHTYIFHRQVIVSFPACTTSILSEFLLYGFNSYFL